LAAAAQIVCQDSAKSVVTSIKTATYSSLHDLIRRPFHNRSSCEETSLAGSNELWRNNADPKDAFSVIAPSLPGYGLSFKPGQKRFILQEAAACLHDLMTEVLGFKKFAVQGGDWGAGIASIIGQRFPSSVCGIHLNLLFAPRDRTAVGTSPEERRYADIRSRKALSTSSAHLRAERVPSRQSAGSVALSISPMQGLPGPNPAPRNTAPRWIS
jgi:pimeloyl-ACP methyl ester carboxylesterase